MTVTRAWLESCRTERGGYTRAQIEALGVAYPPPHGWLSRLVGRPISAATMAAVERGRTEYAHGQQSRRYLGEPYGRLRAELEAGWPSARLHLRAAVESKLRAGKSLRYAALQCHLTDDNLIALGYEPVFGPSLVFAR